jgi:hypothetical protein
MAKRNKWKAYMEAEAKKKEATMNARLTMKNLLEQTPQVVSFSTAYSWVKFSTQEAADKFKAEHPAWDVEVGATSGQDKLTLDESITAAGH